MRHGHRLSHNSMQTLMLSRSWLNWVQVKEHDYQPSMSLALLKALHNMKHLQRWDLEFEITA